LAFIPKDVFGIRTLEELDLSNNKITALEPAIAELFRLKVLNLENNAITELPEEVMQLPKLSTLGLKGNPLGKQFEPLLSIKFADTLQDVLSHCFEARSPMKVSGGKTMAETPSWLMEEKREKKPEEQSGGWEPNLFRPQTGSKTAYGRRGGNKAETQAEVEP
jgi:hypothetical protein